MSLQNNGNTWLYTLTEPVAVYPCTISIWAKIPNITASYALAAIDKPAPTGYEILAAINAAGASSGDPIQAFNYNGSSFGLAASTAGYTANTWFHACGVFTNATSRDAFIAGGSKGSNADNVSGTPSELVLCRRRRNAQIGQMPSGSYIAEIAVYNSALSDANVALLAGGTNPQDIAEGPVAYWPLTTLTTNEDQIGSNDLSAGGSPVYAADHPSISEPGAGGEILVPSYYQHLLSGV
jgi:hypothetical protein